MKAHSQKKRVKSLIIAGAAAVLAGCSSVEDPESLSSPEKLMQCVFDTLSAYTVHRNNVPSSAFTYTTPASLYYAAADTLKGNRYTLYIEASDVQSYLNNFEIPASKLFGFQMNTSEDTVYISQVYEKTPAFSAGVKKGDRIIAVNGKSIYGSVEIFQSLTEKDQTYTISLLRDTVAVTVTMSKDLVELPVSLSDSLTPDVGYIALSSFIADSANINGSTSHQFKKSLAATAKFPVTIIDLRDNGGGYIGEFASIAEEFVPNGDTLALVEMFDRRSGKMVSMPYTAEGTPSIGSRKFVLLVNEHSASASELLTIALTDNLDVPTVGAVTYGKAIGQGSFSFEHFGGGYGHITLAKFEGIKTGKYAHTGIKPNYPAALSYEKFRDSQLEAAIDAAYSHHLKKARPAAVRSAENAKKISIIGSQRSALPQTPVLFPELGIMNR